MEKEIILKELINYFDNKIKVKIIKKNDLIFEGLILEIEGDLIILENKNKGSVQIYLDEIENVFI